MINPNLKEDAILIGKTTENVEIKLLKHKTEEQDFEKNLKSLGLMWIIMTKNVLK